MGIMYLQGFIENAVIYSILNDTFVLIKSIEEPDIVLGSVLPTNTTYRNPIGVHKMAFPTFGKTLDIKITRVRVNFKSHDTDGQRCLF